MSARSEDACTLAHCGPHRGDVAPYDRQSAGHRLDGRVGRSLGQSWQDEHVGGAQPVRHAFVGHRASEQHLRSGGLLGSGADEYEPQVRHLPGGIEQPQRSFALGESANEYRNGPVLGKGQFSTGIGPAARPELLCIDGVRQKQDAVRGHSKLAYRVVPIRLRDGDRPRQSRRDFHRTL